MQNLHLDMHIQLSEEARCGSPQRPQPSIPLDTNGGRRAMPEERNGNDVPAREDIMIGIRELSFPVETGKVWLPLRNAGRTVSRAPAGE